MSIIQEIVERRKKRIARFGHAMGLQLPARRQVPVIAFGRRNETGFFIICEVKRGSPSKGLFAEHADAATQVRHYEKFGVRTVSVLTEEEYFHGSLEDLYLIKTTFPELCLLRKDFIVDEEDIDVSYRAGADAVLLIASMHGTDKLRNLYRRIRGSGMQALLEIHDEEDLKKIREIQPAYTGINSRDLRTFLTDPAIPLALHGKIDWKTETVYESGIKSPEDALVALSGGFSGLLIGEAVMKNPLLIQSLADLKFDRRYDFWYRLFQRKRAFRPLVKICGITREEDAVLAASTGADVLGFIFADSPRRAEPALLQRISDLNTLKVGVVVQSRGDRNLKTPVHDLLSAKLLDAVQFHGDEGPEDCLHMAFPYYKALRIGNSTDAERVQEYHCPRVLVDAYVKGKPGGTGMQIRADLITHVRNSGPLWLAGGIGRDNVAALIRNYKPELIDASSRLEIAPGMKDRESIIEFFETIENETGHTQEDHGGSAV
jgi:indole-3-glycerol phosphate synthase/phosphoribosylanthranilate isomerase